MLGLALREAETPSDNKLLTPVAGRVASAPFKHQEVADGMVKVARRSIKLGHKLRNKAFRLPYFRCLIVS